MSVLVMVMVVMVIMMFANQRGKTAEHNAMYVGTVRPAGATVLGQVLVARHGAVVHSLIVTPRCYNGVTVVSQWCYGGVPVISRWCCSDMVQ
jgi:hypothetical protein